MRIGKWQFQDTGKTYVMGILNVTPDSFSDGGSYDEASKALFQAEKMVKEGAHILDIGGESTRPGYQKISCQEEIERVCPVIEQIVEKIEIPLSIDTYKAPVAKAALEAGAHMVNDIWGLKGDESMAEVAANHKAAVCLMHNRKEPEYKNFTEELKEDLRKSIDLALEAGIEKDQILLDPGVGFAKSYEENLQAMAHMEELLDLGYPYLLGCSRKSVIGLTLDLPVDQREEGTIATSVLAVTKGAMFVRVHQVEKNVRAIQMTEAILAARRK